MAVHLIPIKRTGMPALFTVRAYCDVTFAAVVVSEQYIDPRGHSVDFLHDTPSSAGAHIGLLWMEANYSGVATPHRRSIVFNRRFATA